MNLSEHELTTQKDALKFINENRNLLLDKFIFSKNVLRLDLLTIFMAGSPGAGKTEFSKRYIPTITNNLLGSNLITQLAKLNIDTNDITNFLIRIDVDEIREFIPQYCKTDLKKNRKGNSEIIQKAANKGLDIIRNYCLENEISFLHDGTFSNYITMKKIIKRSLGLKRKVIIFFLYMDPLVAWEFTKAREFLEGRNILKEKFVEQFFDSRKNTDKIKKEFGNKIEIHGVLKNDENHVELIDFNIDSVENFLEIQKRKGKVKDYSSNDLLKQLI